LEASKKSALHVAVVDVDVLLAVSLLCSMFAILRRYFPTLKMRHWLPLHFMLLSNFRAMKDLPRAGKRTYVERERKNE
jgi:hypothetical protein